MDILAELNPTQREAVEAVAGPVLILAGPGSGKTRVITHRIAYLIKVMGITPYRIMAVTFTNKAAKEMEFRLFGHSEGDSATPLLNWSMKGQVTIGTFHAICARILRQDGREIGVAPGFVIYDDDDQISLLKNTIRDVGLDPKQYVPRAIASAISAAKSRLLTPPDYARHARGHFEEVVGRVYERYQASLAASNAVDFDDLLMQAVLLFNNSPEVLSRYQERYRHLLVDEFQDTNLVQYELIKQLGGKVRNICVVGDPDQSIYSWRHADLRNILSFEKDFPEAKVVLLEQNYRSTQRILETASHVIAANKQRKPKVLWTDNAPGEPVSVVETYTEQEEAQFVVREIERLVDAGKAQLSDFAVTYRTNAQSRALEEAFIRYGTPYKLVAATRFYERREIKDIIAYLRLIQNPDDNISLQRIINVPGRGIGQVSLGQLSSWAKSLGVSLYQALGRLVEGGTDQPKLATPNRRAMADFYNLMQGLAARREELSLAALFDQLIKETGYREYIINGENGEERWDNIMELRTVAQDYTELKPGDGLSAFLEGVALVSDVDALDETRDVVTLVTLHQAKGLEFPVVFIAGVEDGILPHIRSLDDPSQLEEERRLFYVGITRAKHSVYLVYAFRRNLMGSSRVNKPSRFLEDIPSHLVTSSALWQTEADQVLPPVLSWGDRPAPPPDLPEFKAGDHVHHAHFGNGVVVSSQPTKDDREIIVAFGSDFGVKKLLQSLAKLERVEKA